MKKPMTSILFALMSTSLLAQQNGYQNNGNQQVHMSSKGASCMPELVVSKTDRMDKTKEQQGLSTCEELKIISIMNEDEASFDQPDITTTMDGKITCRKNGGYTVDFNDCKQVRTLYDSVILAETAMFAAQTIKVNENNIQQSKDVAVAAQKGDLQYGAIDAVVKRNELNHKLNQTQVKTYGLAITALSGGIAKWQGKKSLSKYCKKNLDSLKTNVSKSLAYKDLSDKECDEISKKHKSLVFQNDDARNRFVTELGTLFKKLVDAKARAGMNEFVADRLPKQPGMSDEETTALDACVTGSLDPECINKNPPNIKPSTFGGSTVQFGSGAGNNQDFNFDPNDPANIGNNAPVNGASTENIADMTSPFEQEARDASGILDPAAAASITPGSGGGAGGGGGGAGGGGGGGASLGDDLEGATADDNSDPEIKSNQVAGKYKSGGGGGSQAVIRGGGKDDENPFASMFDSKGEAGGIEEDRSIASDDGEASGLFEKISKKYGQIQQDKRIESQNVE